MHFPLLVSIDYNSLNTLFHLSIVIINVGILLVEAQNTTAISADLFVESIGVNTHWTSPGVYINKYNDLKAKLEEAGIRYVRDHTNAASYIRANDLYQSLGIKTIMITGRYKSGSGPHCLDPTQIEEELNQLKDLALVTADSLEGPNEYDLEHGNDTNWIENLQNYTIVLHKTAKADEKLKNIPIVAPSLTSLSAFALVGNLDPYIDYVNMHPYFGVTWPDFPGWDANGSYSINWFRNYLAPRQSPSGKRIQATETGYHNFIPHNGVSEEADGKYMARTLMEFFRRGIYRTYKYELVNQNITGQEGNFGLLRADLSEKPSYRAMKNLIAILSDRGPSFESGSLNYTLSGSMDNVRQLLFQKRNGDFYLIVWIEVPSFDIKTKVDLYPPPQQVLLTLLNSTKISSASLYAFNNTSDVNTSSLPINNNQINFNATDKISIIKLSN